MDLDDGYIRELLDTPSADEEMGANEEVEEVQNVEEVEEVEEVEVEEADVEEVCVHEEEREGGDCHVVARSVYSLPNTHCVHVVAKQHSSVLSWNGS